MDTVVARAGMWFTLLVIAIVAVAGAHDTGFAVHMWIVAGVAGIGLWASVARVDYQAIAQGILRSPADPGRYDDEPIRWGVLATVFWAMVGLFAGLYIALQLRFPELNLGSEYTTFGRLRPLHTSAVVFAFGGNALIATLAAAISSVAVVWQGFPALLA